MTPTISLSLLHSSLEFKSFQAPPILTKHFCAYLNTCFTFWSKSCCCGLNNLACVWELMVLFPTDLA
jgi:hypothetical protein